MRQILHERIAIHGAQSNFDLLRIAKGGIIVNRGSCAFRGRFSCAPQSDFDNLLLAAILAIVSYNRPAPERGLFC